MYIVILGHKSKISIAIHADNSVRETIQKNINNDNGI